MNAALYALEVGGGGGGGGKGLQWDKVMMEKNGCYGKGTEKIIKDEGGGGGGSQQKELKENKKKNQRRYF